MTLIDGDALMEVINALSIDPENDGYDGTTPIICNKLFSRNELEELIDGAAIVNIEKWILCNEKLPEDCDVYEVTAFWHETWQTMYGIYQDGIWWCVPFNNTGEHQQKLHVKAWRRKTEPYKGDTE